jgi:hypothetical protein
MPDTLLAAVSRTDLSIVLTAFHRNGYGHVVRVLDPDRAPLAEQLNRAGVDASRLGQSARDGCVLLLVPAPKRTGPAASLAIAHGALDCELVSLRSRISPIIPNLISSAGERRIRRTARRMPTVQLACDAGSSALAD